MASDSDTKLTRYTSAVTVITADVMNALYGGEYGYNTIVDEYDPVIYGHVHDGTHADGHASKVLLTSGAHVRGHLAHENLGGHDGSIPAVQFSNIQCYPESIYGRPSEYAEPFAIPEYTEEGGERCYYLDLSMTIGGDDTHVQYNKDGEFGGDSGFIYDYENGRVGIGEDSPSYSLDIGHPEDAKQLRVRGGWDDSLDSNSRIVLNDSNFGIGAGQYGSGGSEDATVIWSYEGAGRGILFASTPAWGSTYTFEQMNHNMFIAGDTGRVGIGTVKPDSLFHVSSKASGEGTITLSQHNDDVDGPSFIFEKARLDPSDNIASAAPGDFLGSVQFYGYDGSGNDLWAGIFSSVDGVPASGTSRPSDLSFWTTENTTTDLLQRMVINNEGNVGINETSPTTFLHITGDGANPPVIVENMIAGSGTVVVWDSGTNEFKVDSTIGSDQNVFDDITLTKTGTGTSSGGPIVADDTSDTLTLIAGDGIDLSGNAGADSITITSTAIAVPGGNNTNIQFNDSGSFGGDDGFYYNKTPSDPVVSILNTDPENAGGGRKTVLSFEGTDSSGNEAALASLQASHEGDLADSKGQLNIFVNDGVTGPEPVIKISSNGFTGIGAVNDGEPVRRLHIKQYEVPPLRINDLSYGEGIVMVWDPNLGDVYVDPTAGNMSPQPSSKVWPPPAIDGGPTDVVFDKNDSGGIIIIKGPWNGSGKVVLPSVPPSAGEGGSWDNGDHFWIKNFSKDVENENFISIQISSDNANDTLDGDQFDNSFTLGPKHTVHISCLKQEGSQINQWIIISHYHPFEQQEQANDNSPPVAEIAGEYSGGDNEPTVQVTGGDTILAGTVVTIDGSNSYDMDIDPLTYIWSGTVDGGVIIMPGPDVVNFEIDTTEVAGSTLTVGLKVNDGSVDSPEVFLTFDVVANQKPVITLIGSSPLELDAGSLDIYTDDGATAYDDIDGDISADIVVSGDIVNMDSVGQYIINYNVTDSMGLSADTVSRVVNINAVNQKPVAALYVSSAEPYSTPISNSLSADSIYLNGEGSSDPNGDSIVTYSFSEQVDGSYNTLLESSNDKVPIGSPGGGTHTFRLIVNDGNLDSDPVYASLTVNHRPVAVATGDASGTVGQAVSLDGSSSYDNDNEDTLTYEWSFVSKPAQSNLTDVNSPNSETPSFTPDASGDYTVRLIVSDSKEYSLQDTVDTTVSEANQAPDVTVTLNDGNVYEVGENIVVHADASDTDGFLVSYNWYLPSDEAGYPVGSNPQLTDSGGSFSGDTQVEAFQTTFTTDMAGTYKVRARVYDGEFYKNDDVMFTMAAANVGPSVSITSVAGDLFTDSTITLTSVASDDDGTIESYLWTVESAADGGGNSIGVDTYSFVDNSVSESSFIATISGTYKIRVTVQDDDSASAYDETNVEIAQAAANTLPAAVVTQISVTTEQGQGWGIDLDSFLPDNDMIQAFDLVPTYDFVGGDGDPDVPNMGFDFSEAELPPNAEDFYNTTIGKNDYIFLWGGKSSDAEDTGGDYDWQDLSFELTYNWKFTQVPAGSVYEPYVGTDNPTISGVGAPVWYNGMYVFPVENRSPILKFRPDRVGSYKMQLTIEDSSGGVDKFICWIFVYTQPGLPISVPQLP